MFFIRENTFTDCAFYSSRRVRLSSLRQKYLFRFARKLLSAVKGKKVKTQVVY